MNTEHSTTCLFHVHMVEIKMHVNWNSLCISLIEDATCYLHLGCLVRWHLLISSPFALWIQRLHSAPELLKDFKGGSLLKYNVCIDLKSLHNNRTSLFIYLLRHNLAVDQTVVHRLMRLALSITSTRLEYFPHSSFAVLLFACDASPALVSITYMHGVKFRTIWS